MKKFLLSLLIVTATLQLKAQFVTSISSDVNTVACRGSAQLNCNTVPEKIDYYTPLPFYQIYFYNSEIGFIVGGGGIILKTTDGGKTWADKTFNPQLQQGYWHSISFINADTGFILSGEGVLAKTTDGGESWEVKNTYTECYTIKFINASTGFMLGNSGLIKKTIDGGDNWYIVPSGTGTLLRDIAFISDTRGFIVGDQENYENTLLKTTDGGETWVKGHAPDKLYSMMLDISFYNDSLGYIHADDILKTTDGGENWSIIQKLCYSPVVTWDENTSFYSGNKMWILSSDNTSTLFFDQNSPVFYMAGPDHKSLFFVTSGSEIYRYIKPISYHWEPSTGLSDADIPNPVATPLVTTTYRVSVEAADGEVRYDSITIYVDKDTFTPGICKITVDSLSQHNIIMWDSPGADVADSVYLYKEGNVSNQFSKIAVLPSSQPGQFVDIQSDVTVKSERYALSMLDKCSFETDRGTPHKAVHLSINQGLTNSWNLIWEKYEGVDVLSYNIYRGSASDTLRLMASVAGSVSQYTDYNADTVNTYYQIESILASYCSGLKSANSSYSNIVNRLSSPHGVGQIEAGGNFKISNNPVSDIFSIVTDHFSEISRVAVFTVNGKQLRNWYHPSENAFDISDVRPGIYLVKIEYGTYQQTVARKLIKL